MRNRRIPIFIGILVLLLSISVYFNITLAADSTPEPGSDQDPLVSKSYVDSHTASQTQELADLKAKYETAQSEIKTLKDEVESLKTSGGGGGQSMKVVSVKAGQAVYTGAGTEVVICQGKAVAIKGQGGGLLDVTAARELPSGAALVLNHLNISSRDDNRGFKTDSACRILVWGAYRTGAAPTVTEPPKDTSIGKGVVNATSLYIRTSPSTTAAIAGKLAKGNTVTLIQKSGEWYRIKTSAGVSGWVMAKYITVKN